MRSITSLPVAMMILLLTSCSPPQYLTAQSTFSNQTQTLPAKTIEFDSPNTHKNTRQDSAATVSFFLCPSHSCSKQFTTWISNATNVSCAFYSLSDTNVIAALKSSQGSLVFDDDVQKPSRQFNDAVFGPPQHTMHNKFCIFDNSTVATGSYNPSTQSHQDILIHIHHPRIATIYRQEFEELRNGVFGGGNTSIPTPVLTPNGSLLIYFCPEDLCEQTVVQQIEAAKHTILIEAYSLTSQPVKKSIQNAHLRGVNIAGVLESSQDRQRIAEEFTRNGLDVTHDKRKGLMHRKIFIIDSHTLLAGSPNPTFSGYHTNDENMILLNDPILVGQLQKDLLQELCPLFDDVVLSKQFLEAVKFRC